MRSKLVWLVGLLVFLAAPVAHAGDNRSDSSQAGSSQSGDAVGGPVVAIAGEGDVRLEAVNRTGAGPRVSLRPPAPDVIRVVNVQGSTSVRTGDARGQNNRAVFVGLAIEQPAVESLVIV